MTDRADRFARIAWTRIMNAPHGTDTVAIIAACIRDALREQHPLDDVIDCAYVANALGISRANAGARLGKWRRRHMLRRIGVGLYVLEPHCESLWIAYRTTPAKALGLGVSNGR